MTGKKSQGFGHGGRLRWNSDVWEPACWRWRRKNAARLKGLIAGKPESTREEAV
ncbi:hypothetical protein UCMB321_2874 [Pseudomonas batumici]|uniref:Uncharacterized protein n=1 Tax=Pseudomonas batumici TaxID=226910 RepID=A0A0C2EX58_9PSED|nr:hypothetical protein UCMB321_2874 [Pseudomonas batumici]